MKFREINKRILECKKTNGKSLDLSGLNIQDLSILSNLSTCSHLEKLSLNDNEITKIENLSELTNLIELNLVDNKISKIENLDSLTKLENLYLGSNKISKIENLDKFINLKRLYIDFNQIKKIENMSNLVSLTELWLNDNEISKIENLESLIEIKKLVLISNNISKIENLENLVWLESLWLAGNKIKKIENLESQINIHQIDLSYNQISKISNLRKLPGLMSLHLASNNISTADDIIELRECKSITNLDIFNNPFLHTYDLVLKGNENHLDIINNVLAQTTSHDHIEYAYPLKIVIIGNHAMGKSNLIEFLQSGAITPLTTKDNESRSTHGLNIIPYYLDPATSSFPDAMIYDFGGQDYYHGLYRTYLNYGCSYIILWKHQVTKCEQKIDNTKQNNLYFDLHYWLGQKAYYDSSTYTEGEIGPIILLQGYGDQEERINPVLTQSHSRQIIDSLQVCLCPSNYQQFRLELELVKKRIAALINSKKTSAVRANWYKEFITHIYDNLLKADHNPVNINALSGLFLEGSIQTELLQLHNKGVVIYEQDILPEIVWLNPSAFSRHVWNTILPKEKLINNKGRMPISELNKFPNELAILKKQKIIFLYKNEKVYLVPNFLEEAPLSDNEYKLLIEDFKEPVFEISFDNYVPIAIINQVICFFGDNNDATFWKNEIRFTLDDICKVRIYFDLSLFKIKVFVAKKGDTEFDRKMIIAYLFHCIIRMYWDIPILENLNEFIFIRKQILKYNLLYYGYNKFRSVLPELELAPTNLETVEFHEYYPTDKHDTHFNFYRKERFDGVINIYKNEHCWAEDIMISVDGVNNISYKELSKTVCNNQDLEKFKMFNATSILNGSQTRISINDLEPFIGTKLKKYDKMKKIFICYSSNDVKYKDQLKKFLFNPINQGKIVVWDDHELNPGDDWDEEIKNNLKNADLVVLLVSQDSIISKYINSEEMAITLERLKNGKVSLFPVLVRPADFSDWQILPKNVAGAANNKLTKIGKFQFFPKVNGKLEPISTLETPQQEQIWLDLKNILVKMLEI